MLSLMRSVELDLTFVRDWHCRRCFLYKKATVRAHGRGQGAFRATQNAANDADECSVMLLGLKRCPSCGARNEAIARRNRRTRIATAICTVLLGGGSFALVGALLWIDDLARWAIAPLVLFFLGMTYVTTSFMRLRYPSDAEALVTLEDPPRDVTWRPVAQDAELQRTMTWWESRP